MIERKSKHEYRVHLSRITPKPTTVDELKEAIDWCITTFGPGGRNKKCRWRYGWVHRSADYFYFRNEKDALFFVLRWS